MKRNVRLSRFFILVPILVGSSVALAQDAGAVVYPRDNISGGAIGARRPGLWVSEAISNHTERMTSVLQDHGGADPQPIATDDPAEDRHTLILTTLLQSLFDSLQGLADALVLAATLGSTTTTTGS